MLSSWNYDFVFKNLIKNYRQFCRSKICDKELHQMSPMSPNVTWFSRQMLCLRQCKPHLSHICFSANIYWLKYFVPFERFLISSDEFIRIQSNFDFSNFKSWIRMSNLVEFKLFDQIRLNSTSNLTNFRLVLDNIRL